MFSRLLSLAAATGLAAAPIAGQAQQATAQGNLLGLPSDLSMLRDTDPNRRVATAVVNGFVITETDVDHRVALLLAANQRPVSEEEMIRVRMQVLRNLIDETLQIQAAEAQELEVAQAEIDQTYAGVAAQNFEQRPESMDEYLRSIGSSPATLKRQIKGELAWNRLLRRNIAPFVNVSAEEVNELIERLEASRGTEEYRLGEIYLSATPETEAAVEANANQIVEQLRQGGSFVAYARQFSEASTAAVGGDLGWIQLAQLKNAQLEAVASEMSPGQLVGPIRIPGGFSILYLIDKRQVLMADPRDALLSLKQIQITFDPGTTPEAAQQRVAAFTEGVRAIRGCGDADNAAAALGATVVTNDQIRVRSLPDQLQNIILQLQVGQSTPPFGSFEEGVRVLMLCGRDDPQIAAGPDFDQLMGQLEDERVQKRAQRYLRDLRNDAFIEYN
ncbi:MAG: peptidylprolyl isomerase [Erythrobacter sp.]|nr:peptidylprolyl isomerase [Erythrobacter sp.]MBO6528727.1 peptidylprolyl isomerase [Erythrobacter sp.]